jgi:hypothetical protein
MSFVTVAYCTKGGYEEEANKLRASLEKLNIQHQVRVIYSLGSWQKNCLYKPLFIREMLQKYKKPVLYVDADAVIHKPPALLDTLNADFAVHYFRNLQLASGTLYFNNSVPAINLLDAWIERNRNYPNDADQDNLQHVLEKPGWKNRIKIHYLPAEYCKIFDLMPGVNDPVIEHFQASRRLRAEENITFSEKRKYKEQWQSGYRPSQCALFLPEHIHNMALPEDSLLEIGCGDGSTIRGLCDKGRRCSGVDITLAGIKGDKTGFLEAPAWRMPFKDSQFDLTFSTDVLEHLPFNFVEASIKEICRVTRRKTFHVIASFPDQRNGVELHLTIRPVEWWLDMFSKHSSGNIEFEIMDRKDFLQKVGYGTERAC